VTVRHIIVRDVTLEDGIYMGSRGTGEPCQVLMGLNIQLYTEVIDG
jgi:hypothetical protein